MSGQSTLRIQNVTKSYRSGETTVDAVKEISLDIAEGETVAIFGPSGSGKTTLLGLCAGLDRPSSGDISIEGESLNSMDEIGLSRLRNEKIGFIFQSFRLIPSLTALENVMIPAEIRGDRGVEERAVDLLRRVGLENRLHNYPSQLSGGEQQRVAIARAFVNEPRLLFADEPTGNLDEENAEAVRRLLFEINQARGTTLVIVTHDPAFTSLVDRLVVLKGGHVDEIRSGAPSTALP
ncbi:MAG: ABC transporter ATP-binding protein [Bacteroidetes bacterium]|nr:ABC transporter ATP-binding protein [Bacteroidota bacterium]